MEEGLTDHDEIARDACMSLSQSCDDDDDADDDDYDAAQWPAGGLASLPHQRGCEVVGHASE